MDLSGVLAIACPPNLLLLKDVGLGGGSWHVQGRSVKNMNLFSVIHIKFLLRNFLIDSALSYIL